MLKKDYGPVLDLRGNLDRLRNSLYHTLEDIKTEYDSEIASILSRGISAMADSVRDKNELLNGEANDSPTLTPELENDANDARGFLEDYKATELKKLPPRVRDLLMRNYNQALETVKIYEKALQEKRKSEILGRGDQGGVLIEKDGDGYALFPTIYFEDIEKNPSLMLNLLEYCLSKSDELGFEWEVPENYDGKVRIAMKGKSPGASISKLKEALDAGRPKGFEEANLDFIVISKSDYELGLGTLPKVHIESQVLAEQPKEEVYSFSDALRKAGLDPKKKRETFIFYEARDKAIKRGLMTKPEKGCFQEKYGNRKIRLYSQKYLDIIKSILWEPKETHPRIRKITESSEPDEEDLGNFKKYSLKEAAKELGVRAGLLYEYREKGIIPKRGKRSHFYLIDEDIETIKKINKPTKISRKDKRTEEIIKKIEGKT